MNKVRENRLRRQIVNFTEMLAIGSDNAYVLPEQNLVYLKGLALGWLMAQRWYAEYRADILSEHARENVELTLAEGIIHDIIAEETSENPAFNSRSTPRKASRA